MRKQGQPALRLVGGTACCDWRKKFQSTSGRISSHLTFPQDSRSIEIAKDSAQDRNPYAIFRRWPAVVEQRVANSRLSANVLDFRKAFRSMDNYHHTVTEKATPSVEFTKRCYATDNAGMSNPTAAIRRKNLQRLIERDFGGNQSEIARVYNPENPKPQYFSDLLRPGATKPFGEKAARNIEEKTGLLHGQLDIPDSPLTSDESKRSRLKDELRLAVNDLDREEQHEALLLLRKLRSRRSVQRKAG